MTQKFVKIVFDLDRDPEEESFPPVGSETLNAIVVDGQGYILDNTPFFVSGVSLGDLVAAMPTGTEGRYEFDKVLEESNAKAISIIFMEAERKDAIRQKLEHQGCYCEYGEFGKTGKLKMLAVSIPETVEYEGIFAYLYEMREREVISFAELAV